MTDTEDAEEADSDTEETPEYSEMDTDISTTTSTSGGIGIHLGYTYLLSKQTGRIIFSLQNILFLAKGKCREAGCDSVYMVSHNSVDAV